MLPTSPAPQTLLIVDDDRIARLFLKSILTRSGYRIIEAGNGAEAVAAFDQEKPDLILMDVSMPVMTGYAAATVIKRLAAERFIPIIFLTALSDDASLAQCVASGGDDFLPKPVNKVLLTAKITAMQRISQMNQELAHYKQRTEEEIELAQHVFNSLTQRMSRLNLPELDYWQCAAGHFNGDLIIYDQSPLGKRYVMLGDFTGHGFSAAIGALPTADIFFAMTRRDFTAEEIVAEINRKLREIMPCSHFCATAFICFDPETRRIDIFNGGLPPIVFLDADGKPGVRVESSNLALGILPPESFQAEITQIDHCPVGTWVIYSDGATEAQSSVGDMFGDARLQESLCSGSKPLEAARAAIEAFTGHQALNDDISIVTLRT